MADSGRGGRGGYRGVAILTFAFNLISESVRDYSIDELAMPANEWLAQ